MNWKKNELSLIKRFDKPETVFIVTSYPERDGESALRNAIANYSRELARELGKQVPLVIISEIISKPEVYLEDGVLVVRTFERGNWVMNWQISRALNKFNKAKQVLLQFEFGVYGGSIVTFLLSLLGSMLKLTGFSYSVMLHQVTHDLGELTEHLGIPPISYKTALYNLGMRFFYRLIGWGSDQVLVHNKYLAGKLKTYIKEEKIGIVAHGVGKPTKSISRVNARKIMKWRKNDYIVLVFGYLSWYKGSDWIVNNIGRIMKKYPKKSIKLIMAGGESGTLKEMPHYRNYVNKLYLTADKYGIEITGYINDRDKEKYFAGCDLVVLPHRVAMSESGVMAHVATYGKPFLASIPRTSSLSDPELVKLTGFELKGMSLEKKLLRLMRDTRLQTKIALMIAREGRKRTWEKAAITYLAAIPDSSKAGYTGARYDVEVAV